MWKRIRHYLTPDSIEGHESHVQTMLQAIFAIVLIGTAIITATAFIAGYNSATITTIAFFATLPMLWLTRRGQYTLPRLAMPLIAFVTATYLVVANDGIRDEAVMGFPLTMALAGLILGKAGIVIYSSLSIVAVFVVGYAEVNGLIVTSFSENTSYYNVIMLSSLLGFVGALLYVTVSNLSRSLERARRGEQEASSLLETVQARSAELEERTRVIETIAEVSRRLSTILDQRQLVTEVVELLQQAFGYYHAHIYLVDEASGDLLMAGGTGEVGRALLAKGHRIPRGKGLSGRAADTNAAVLVPDVAQQEGWLPNPLLPDTKSESAVPIAVGDRVLGVLDVQHNTVGGLSGSDAELLGSIASQIAIALQNAHLFSAAQQRAEREALINAINQNIQRATSLESMLQIAARELGQAMGVQRASVQLALGTDGDHSRN